ncbi:MAG: hypothetical protein ACLSB9_21875 [Hydrogeniiclostridium mannosilyticum]
MASVTDLLFTMNEWDYALAKKHRLGTRVVSVPGVGVDFSRLDACPELTKEVLRNQLNIPEDAVVMLYPPVFRAEEQAVLIRAMACLPGRAVPESQGDGEHLEDCKALAKAWGWRTGCASGHVSLMGQWYRMADIAVSASRVKDFHSTSWRLCTLGFSSSQQREGSVNAPAQRARACSIPTGMRSFAQRPSKCSWGLEDMREHLGAAGRRRWYNIVWIRPSLVSWSFMKSWPWRTKQNLWRGKWWVRCREARVSSIVTARTDNSRAVSSLP